MAFGKKEVEMDDPFFPSQFSTLLLGSFELKTMCLFIYVFVNLSRQRRDLESKPSFYSFVNLIISSFGGGIIVPTLLNLPIVPFNDLNITVLIAVYVFQHTFPKIVEVYRQSVLLHFFSTIMFQAYRATVVTSVILKAISSIPPSFYDSALFGPIFCGTIGGCGGGFMPLSKGLEPLKGGANASVLTAFMAATGFHIWLIKGGNEIDGKIGVSLFLIGTALYGLYDLNKHRIKTE
ncbi:hypothetical protein TrCOL_g9128 [Triparma columacea]|uniref:Uncharacterized protein n=1 Tax=Triparma columacea TaxID=722753 RepID=A0A9W7GD68_9STRA|nr:hypothetical protein TrCOL_g9128 [Triparma columacea]